MIDSHCPKFKLLAESRNNEDKDDYQDDFDDDDVDDDDDDVDNDVDDIVAKGVKISTNQFFPQNISTKKRT